MILFPNAKINIGLHVGPRRDDGFHDLWTVFWPVDWCDILEITPAQGDETTLTVTGRPVMCPPYDNLVYRAWEKIDSQFHIGPVDIHLRKIIPEQAGLGGGSSDASFTLIGLNRMFALGLSEAELAEIALSLGADCPFFIYNRPMSATGKGEIFGPLPDVPLPFPVDNSLIAIVKPNISISTGQAFADLDNELSQRPEGLWVNHFEAAVAKRHPVIADIVETLLDMGALYASMSGSGSAVYAIFPDSFTGLKERLDAVFADCEIYSGPFRK